jgi:ribonuclease J
VDAGIKFAGDNKLIDGIIPSMEYLKKNEKKIRGLIITHGHEDHIGAVPHLINAVKIPKIYAGKLAANMIFGKFRERGVRKVPTQIIDNKYVIKSRNFKIEFANVTHSIPDSYAVKFETKQGTIFHTGDFKFDLTPVGTSADILKMAQ